LKKAIYILFTFYFIALAVLPCTAKDDCADESGVVANGTQQHQENDQDECCTPFCVCSTCAAHFLIQDFCPSLEQSTVVNSVYTVQKDAEICSAIIPIWQPPKVVC